MMELPTLYRTRRFIIALKSKDVAGAGVLANGAAALVSRTHTATHWTAE
jgi:hypothetical protein